MPPPDSTTDSRPASEGFRNCTSGVAWPLAIILALTGCSGSQSALDPAGEDAERISTLWWIMAVGSVAIFALMIFLTLRALRTEGRISPATAAKYYIVGGGALFPTVVLTALLIYGLSLMPFSVRPLQPDGLRIRVVGEQWWWRIEYLGSNGRRVESANEIRLPHGEVVEFVLESPDVIHSFWIPALGGKMDMIPGRVTRLRLEATRLGRFRGVCAEFCGDAHARMAFDVVVTSRSEFDQWLDAQAGPAAAPSTLVERNGAQSFAANGCAACHTIRGTAAQGKVGPDLTHFGSRLSLGAGTLSNDIDENVRWLSLTKELKPGVLMPHYGMLPPEELRSLAHYLKSLQ